MKPKSARVARRVIRSARLRDELAAALWELRKYWRVPLSVVAKLERERDEQRAALWRDYHGDPGSP